MYIKIYSKNYHTKFSKHVIGKVKIKAKARLTRNLEKSKLLLLIL